MSTIELELTKGYVALISAEDMDLLDFHWAVKIVNGYSYAQRSYRSGKKIQHEQLGRIVMERKLGHSIPSEPKYVVDYINGNSLDNRRENLRLATYGERAAHRKRRKDAKNPLQGTDYQADCTQRPWRAVIRYNGRYTLIGNYATPQEAHEAYNTKRRELYGVFAAATAPSGNE